MKLNIPDQNTIRIRALEQQVRCLIFERDRLRAHSERMIGLNQKQLIHSAELRTALHRFTENWICRYFMGRDVERARRLIEP